MERKKVIYIAGPITGVAKYWEAFEEAEELLTELGYIALTPSRLPQGMTNEQYTRIDFAMIDSADAVIFLPGSQDSRGASLELKYCNYTSKPWAFLKTHECFGDKHPREIMKAWLKHDLEEVLKK